MKKYAKIALLVLIVIAIVAITIPVFGFTPRNVNPQTGDVEAITNAGNRIIGIIRVVGVIVAVAVLIILGIKYMLGSAEEKAEYKKTLVPYVIGVILVAGAVFIATMVFDWARELDPEQQQPATQQHQNPGVTQ